MPMPSDLDCLRRDENAFLNEFRAFLFQHLPVYSLPPFEVPEAPRAPALLVAGGSTGSRGAELGGQSLRSSQSSVSTARGFEGKKSNRNSV